MLPRRKPFIEGVKNLPATTGKVLFVDPDSAGASDNNVGTDPSLPRSTVSSALSAATTNKHDIIALSANSAHSVTAMLDVSINRVHFESLGCRSYGFGMGARSRLDMGVTTAATDIAVLKNTGVGNTFTGIKFDSSNTVAEGLYAVAEGGEYAIYALCEFYKSTDLDETAAAEVLNNGDSAQWIQSTFGSTANIIADNKIRPNMLLTATLSGKKCRDNIIYQCRFLSKAGGTEAVRIYGANATDVERDFTVWDSIFINNILSAATPAHAVGFGAAQTQGQVFLNNCGSVDHTVMAQAAVGIYVAGAVPTFATTGVSVAS
jgi:hypothetical protein